MKIQGSWYHEKIKGKAMTCVKEKERPPLRRHMKHIPNEQKKKKRKKRKEMRDKYET
jgi:hypothetical protein